MNDKVEIKNIDKFKRLGKMISKFRNSCGMTIEQLAEEANISPDFLHDIENSDVLISFSVNVLFNIADALEVSPNSLFEITWSSKCDIHSGYLGGGKFILD